MTKTLELLGYKPGDRLLIIHADDVGFSHASNVAVFGGLTRGSLTCASALVAAPWFAETAQLQSAHPQADIGVHMALTAEYASYRWRSVSGIEALHAPDGGVWRDIASVQQHVSVDDARAELRAQIEHALAMGIDVTHLDTHMGAVMLPKYLPAYVDLAIEYRLPIFFQRLTPRRLEAHGPAAEVYAEQSAKLEARGYPLLDHMIWLTLSEVAPENKVAQFKEWFAALRPGLTHFITHPAAPGAELSAMTPIDAAHRAKEAEIFGARDMRDYCENLGIKLIGYREVRDRLRAG